VEIKPLRTDEEIRDYIQKNYGSGEEYHRRRFEDPPVPAPKPIAKSAAEISADYYQVAAKAQGLSLEQFFKRNPDEYRRYKNLVISRDY
jgi:hypothetical protein